MRVNVAQAALITGRSEKTIRAWLREDPPALSVEYGAFRGGRRNGKAVQKGRIRLLDLEELRTLHVARGGQEWHEEHIPLPDARGLLARIRELEEEIARLRERERRQTVLPPLGVESYRPPVPKPTSARSARKTGATNLPGGFVGVEQFAEQHGMRESQRSTWVKARDTGRLPVIRGSWVRDGTPVQNALDEMGRHAFWLLWHDRDWFVACDECLAFQHQPAKDA